MTQPGLLVTLLAWSQACKPSWPSTSFEFAPTSLACCLVFCNTSCKSLLRGSPTPGLQVPQLLLCGLCLDQTDSSIVRTCGTQTMTKLTMRPPSHNR